MSSRKKTASSEAAPAQDGPRRDSNGQPLAPFLDPSWGHFSFLASLTAADFFTFMNGACGMLTILLTLQYMLAKPNPTMKEYRVFGTILAHCNDTTAYMVIAFLCSPLSLFFDILDGKVARAFNQTSLLGQELDSLDDLVSFCVAPAVMAFALGMQGGWDMWCLTFFVACGIGRLARYNVTAGGFQKQKEDAAKGKKKRFFEGLPTPHSVVLMMCMAWLWFHGYVEDKRPIDPAVNMVANGSGLPGGKFVLGPLDWELHPISLVFALCGFLMVSRSFKIPKC